MSKKITIFIVRLNSEIYFFDKIIINAVYDMVIQYEQPERLTHNVTMLVDHPVVGKISEIIDSICSLQILKFDFPEMLFHYFENLNFYECYLKLIIFVLNMIKKSF